MTTHSTSARLRWRVKQTLAGVIRSVNKRATGIRRNGAGYRPLVLGYHRVVEDFESAARSEMPSMLISTRMFEQHLDCIGRHFRFVGLDTIGAAIRHGIPFAEPVAAVTFDDGYEDVYQNAVPILKRKGIPAAAFVVTDLVGGPSWQTHDKLFHLVTKGYATWSNPRRQLEGLLRDLGLPAADILRTRTDTSTPFSVVSALLPNLSREDVGRVLQYLEWNVGNGFVGVPLAMTWPMVRQMQRDGFIIGSHTRSHVALPKESAATTADELIESKRDIEHQLGESVDHFAYPGGQFTPAVVEALERAGYRYAYTACPHSDARYPALTIERLLLWEGSSVDAAGEFSPAILECQAQDLWPPARVCRRCHQ
jgi:peptidoglycan/xylan/chitin deacetylase (PgdA/CDA1 family)